MRGTSCQLRGDRLGGAPTGDVPMSSGEGVRAGRPLACRPARRRLWDSSVGTPRCVPLPSSSPPRSWPPLTASVPKSRRKGPKRPVPSTAPRSQGHRRARNRRHRHRAPGGPASTAPPAAQVPKSTCRRTGTRGCCTIDCTTPTWSAPRTASPIPPRGRNRSPNVPSPSPGCRGFFLSSRRLGLAGQQGPPAGGSLRPRQPAFEGRATRTRAAPGGGPRRPAVPGGRPGSAEGRGIRRYHPYHWPYALERRRLDESGSLLKLGERTLKLGSEAFTSPDGSRG